MPADNCNQPATRRDAVLKDLQLGTGGLAVTVTEVPPPLDLSLAAAQCVHDAGYLAFLETAWSRWAPLEHKDTTFCRGATWRQAPKDNDAAVVAAAAVAIPSLIPGNGANRDACVRPGSSVTSQCTFYAADQEVGTACNRKAKSVFIQTPCCAIASTACVCA
jgi:hypothetical protein